VGGQDPQLVDLIGRHVRPQLAGPRRSRERSLGAPPHLVEVVGQPAEVDEPATGQPQRVAAGRVRMGREYQPR
jgi:hypothetical protein